MSTGSEGASAPVLGDAQVERLRDDLGRAEFTVDGVHDVLGDVAAAALQREQPVPARRALRRSQAPAATLARAFVLGDPVPAAALAAALPRTGVTGAAQAGLVEVDGGTVRPLVDLRPYEAEDGAGSARWWLASDLGETATGRALRPDHVLGVGGASVTLAQLTVRERVDRVLDLGTGCGVQALHADRHAARVTATDVSARALAFARFNAALAGVELDLRRGDLLEPVAGEQFDLVVSNPPFVITPRSAGSGLAGYEYRDAGRAGDDVVRDLVTGAGDVLAPGGVAQLLGNWEHVAGLDWRERVAGWLDEAAARGAALDAWVVQREVQDPAEYAETWLRDGGTTPDRDPPGWEAAYSAWLDDFAARDVEGVGFGFVVLRRPVNGAPSLRRVEEVTSPLEAPLGPHLAAVLAAHDWLSGRDDAALADERLVVAPDVTEERHLVPGADHPTLVLLRQGAGMRRVVQVGTAAAGVVGACDGELTVGQLLAGVAALLDVGTSDLASDVLPVLRDLVRDGFLRPSGG